MELEIEHEEVELEYQVEDAMEPETREAVFVEEHFRVLKNRKSTEEEKRMNKMKEHLDDDSGKGKTQQTLSNVMMLGEYQWSSDEKQEAEIGTALHWRTVRNEKEILPDRYPGNKGGL